MELPLRFFSILLTFLLFLYMVMKILKRTKTSDTTFHLPPGPWKLPLIGNLHQLLVGSPQHHILRDLAKKYGPLMHLQLGEVSTVVVSSPEFAKEIMKTHDLVFASRPRTLVSEIMSHGCTGAVFTPYGDYWRQVRRICTLELFSTKRVMSFRSIREEEVANLVSWVASKAGSTINLTEKVHSLIYGIASRAAFGNKFEDQELFISIIDEVTKIAAGLTVADLYPSIEFLQSVTGIRRQIEKLHRKTDRIMERIINEHKKNKESINMGKHEEEAEDLVDALLRVQGQGELEFPLTTDNIKAIILDIFGAGGETAATTIDWTMSELMKNPRLLEKAQAEVRQVFNSKSKVDETSIDEMKFLKLVIKEILRLHPPAPLLVPRESREKCVINGFELPMKTRIIVNAWAIGRDPEYWNEPEIFNPERFLDRPVDYKGTNFEFVPFGSGRRICPGMSFGLMNVEIALAMLLYHFDWKLPRGMKIEDLDMTEVFGITVRRKDDLQLIATPYHPSTAA
ncbi:cytochrome P450 71D11-like [Mangifera indica]|uniref:cytochrome P450 71D11-like n=1 Tax=Mangifera indica TaxID=29780 RepID=UPI001CF9634E|nr:cytochrome P450 71D11-like [Mangifera indica]